MKTIRSIYTVELSEIATWNNENDFPGICDPILEINGKDPSLATASLMHAYHYYKKCKNFIDDEMVELTRIHIEVTDKEWEILREQESLSYEDYSPYIMHDEDTNATLAWSYEYDSRSESNDDVPEELLRNLSSAYNMRYVCDLAGVNYSTFRGFKNNHQGFSLQKIYQLLRCMKSIGDECWDGDLEKRFTYLNDEKNR